MRTVIFIWHERWRGPQRDGFGALVSGRKQQGNGMIGSRNFRQTPVETSSIHHVLPVWMIQARTHTRYRVWWLAH